MAKQNTGPTEGRHKATRMEHARMTEQKIATEVAEQEFQRFLESMDLDVSPEGMDDDDRKSFEQAKRRFLAAVSSGNLVVNEKGEPVFTPRASEPSTPVTFYEPKGATLLAMDKGQKGHDMDKMFKVMAELTRENAPRFAKMAGRDIKVCLAIVGLYLGG